MKRASASEGAYAGLGDDFLAEVDHWIDAIRKKPRTWPRLPDAPRFDPPLRRVLLRRFPFAIGYPLADRVLVVAIAHLSREPLYWVARADD